MQFLLYLLVGSVFLLILWKLIMSVKNCFLFRATSASLFLVGAVLASAQTNVAASANGGVASQSSVWNAANTPDKGNDGNRNGIYAAGSMMHTNSEFGAWYKIDFATATSISQVNVFNRTESESGRLSPFTVSLSLNGSVVWSATNQTFAQNISDPNPNVSGMSFSMSNILADSVKVQLDRTNYLHLAELEAYEVVPEPASFLALMAGVGVLARRRKSK